MERCSLHLVSDDLASSYVQSLETRTGRTEAELNQLTAGLAIWLAEREPVFAGEGLSLTAWEARVDRGLAMLLRPPSRLFLDAGLAPDDARRIPIRIDLDGPVMGGSYLPARLMKQAEEILDRNLARSAKRLQDAERDAYLLHGLMSEAISTASRLGLGLFEASGVIDYSDSRTWPAGARVVLSPQNPEVQRRISFALQPEKEPGAIRRAWTKLAGRGRE